MFKTNLGAAAASFYAHGLCWCLKNIQPFGLPCHVVTFHAMQCVADLGFSTMSPVRESAVSRCICTRLSGSQVLDNRWGAELL